MQTWPPPAPRAAPGAPIAKTDERSWQADATKKPSPQLTAASGYRTRLNKPFTKEIDGLLRIDRLPRAVKSGLVAQQLSLVGPGISEQIEHLHLLPWRLRSRRWNAPEVAYRLRQRLADPIREHGLERRAGCRWWRQRVAGPRKGLRDTSSVRRRNGCRRH